MGSGLEALISSIASIVGYIIIAFIIAFVILTDIVLLRKYKNTKNRSTLYFALAFIFFLCAIALLFIEKVSLASYTSSPHILIEIIGRTNAVLALVMSGTAIVLINIFAFENTFSNKKITLTMLVAIFAVLYISVLTFANIDGFLGGSLATISSGEIIYHPLVTLLSILSSLPLGVPTASVFFYYGTTIRSTNKPSSSRSYWMGVAVLIFYFGYVIEVTSIQIPFVEILIVFGRLFMFIACFILYVCFSMPKWFKNRIGWTED